MTGADTGDWLDLWERAAPGPARRRRRELLAHAGPSDGESASELAIGRANARLLRLYRSMFGRKLLCRTSCPECGAALEMDVDTDELLAREPRDEAKTMFLDLDDWSLAFRLPREGDLDAAEAESDPRAAILRRCVSASLRGGEAESLSGAPPEIVAALAARMEEADPLAVLDFDLRCATCGHAWATVLEPDTFLWIRLDAWARRLSRDIHALASAYGWSERAIPEMSPWRRQLYLDQVGA